jgi:hypothetical protein
MGWPASSFGAGLNGPAPAQGLSWRQGQLLPPCLIGAFVSARRRNRGFAGFDRPPERLFGSNQDGLVDRVGLDRKLNPFATAIDNGKHGFLGSRDQHVVLELRHMFFSAADSSENDHGSMNLASNTAPVSLTNPSNVAAIQGIVRWIAWRCRGCIWRENLGGHTVTGRLYTPPDIIKCQAMRANLLARAPLRLTSGCGLMTALSDRPP